MAAATERTAEQREVIASYLRQPYTRMVVPDDDGAFRGEILEFPGCIAIGDTAAEALASLEEVAADWLDAALSHGQAIPEPFENTDYSGRFVLRLPRSLHKKAALMAARDDSSLNQFIVAAVSEYVGERANEQRQVGILMPGGYFQIEHAEIYPSTIVDGGRWHNLKEFTQLPSLPSGTKWSLPVFGVTSSQARRQG